MRWRLGYLAYFASQFIWGSNAAECRPLTVSLPFKSNVLANRAEARGVSFKIGRPNAQTIALLPSASYNDTYMYGTNGFCAANTTLEKCTSYRGGLYDSALSEGSKTGTSIKHIWDDATAKWTTDDVVLQEEIEKGITLQLPQFDFGVRVSSAHAYVNKGELGLGMNSTFLNALASTQRIASKTYSFFWGTDTAISDKLRNGSLTLGGYDQALIGDFPNTTTTFTRNQWRCREGMVVELTSLSLQSVSGGTQNILEGSEKLQACVVPTISSVLTLPAKYWDKMAKMMGVEPSPFNNGTSSELFYRIASVKPENEMFSGNLSITINNAINVTIRNEQLIFDEPYIASNGLISRNQDWKNIPIVQYTDTNQNMPRLGGMFLSSAYLMVNHDKNEFTISPVQEEPAVPKVVAISTASRCDTAVEGGTSAAAKGSSGISGGVIAGIVVGVVAAIGIMAAIAFMVWRRKRVAPAPKSPVYEIADEGGMIAEKHGYSTSEMYAGQPVGEVSGESRAYAVELDGNSRPSEVPAHGVEGESWIDDRRR
ncbi:uncharacterized protein K460DRAFT_390262 [Cucurbitaria berberidis CBS 394.84]|uniref:Peptidase A1 domain-containing protein n=1 Tax=Cucurbitaria berberidis CBS 394.84 TaxID=1168544 RepID=A0A9P4L2W4_9PLEO|nr:uncharacterized protein K460DRAFT_390262 [Cucurbitaria berberidis CBS 394.84]KAF1840051.1 hypothetical protein K460DRAFT_390262 [Cucurbitaria berberidis CBS 394.84]